MLMLFLEQSRGRPGAREHHFGDTWARGRHGVSVTVLARPQCVGRCMDEKQLTEKHISKRKNAVSFHFVLKTFERYTSRCYKQFDTAANHVVAKQSRPNTTHPAWATTDSNQHLLSGNSRFTKKDNVTISG